MVNIEKIGVSARKYGSRQYIKIFQQYKHFRRLVETFRGIRVCVKANIWTACYCQKDC
jgi:hypothetical protein